MAITRENRQILINPHSSVEKVPVGVLHLGEIAVQHDSTSGASLYIETVSGSQVASTVVRFMNASAVTSLVESARTDLQHEIDTINESVGLPHVDEPGAPVYHWDSAATVWDAIEETYAQLILSAAAATTVVEKDADSEDWLYVNHEMDSGTSAITYFVGTNGIGQALSALSADVKSYVDILSAGTIHLSADTDATIQQLSAGTLQLSADTYNTISALSATVQSLSGVVEHLDWSGLTNDDRKPVVSISETDGIVTAAKGSINADYVDILDNGDLISATTVEGALQEIANKINANEISNADGSINVTPAATGTDINVNIKNGEHVLAKDGDAGLYTNLDLVKVTTGLPATVKERYQFLATDDTQIGVNIDIAKDSHIVSIEYINDSADTHYQNLKYTYIDASGDTQVVYVDMSELVLEAEFASGVTITDHVAHGVVDPASEVDESNVPFLTVGADGFKVIGIKDAIDTKINKLDVTGDTAVAGQYVAAIEETDGVVAVKTRANVSEAVLNNYAKGMKPANTDVLATDTVNEAIAKLEHQIDDAESAATTVVVEGTDPGNNMTIVETTDANDGHKIFTVNLTDVASAAAVGLNTNGTFSADTTARYISAATTVREETKALDEALSDIEERLGAAEVIESGSIETWVHISVEQTSAGTSGSTAITLDDSDLNIELLRLSGAIDTEISARTAADDLLRGTETGSTSAETSLWGVKKLLYEVSKSFATKVDGESGSTALIEVTKTEGDSGDTYDVHSTGRLQSAITSAENAILDVDFVTLPDSGDTARDWNSDSQSGVGANIAGAENNKVLQLDMTLLKVDCGEY